MRYFTTILVACAGLTFGSLACGGDSGSDKDTAQDSTPDTAPDTVEDTAPDTTADTTPDTSEVTLPQPCGTTSAAALAGCVEASRLTADLNTIAGARPTGTVKSGQVVDFLVTRLEALGFTVTRDDYGRGVNVIGTKLGKTSPEELVVISAHHDSVPECPGADDNGSGVVGALEAARILGQVEHDRTLVVALWDEEELGLLGAFDWADRLARSGSKVVVSYVLEMIGYRSDEVDSQTLPAGFDVLFAEATAAVNANGNRGDFIALIADQTAQPYTALMDQLGAATGHSTVSLHVPTTLLGTNLINWSLSPEIARPQYGKITTTRYDR
ncbi:MAG TPA: M28 family peptidase, partial [Myxococcota bacterium]|nr:M28 family peptidase [Myxococcota bacterium]